jgi:hypothetical protein
VLEVAFCSISGSMEAKAAVQFRGLVGYSLIQFSRLEIR